VGKPGLDDAVRPLVDVVDRPRFGEGHVARIARLTLTEERPAAMANAARVEG
jgi:hypothetical protein